MTSQFQIIAPTPPSLDLPPEVAGIFPGIAGEYVRRLIRLALEEDGPDLTAQGVFSPQDQAEAVLVAKQDSLVVGLPLISLIFQQMGHNSPGNCWRAEVPEGSAVKNGHTLASFFIDAITLLKAERVILNLISHLSGVANLTKQYVDQLDGTGVRLLDTRKTLPGMRYPEKYAVRMGGGYNHRMDLAQMLMIKDNHIDASGSISAAALALLAKYNPCPPLEIECRTLAEVQEAVVCRPNRILLDNMDVVMLNKVLPLIPLDIEAEISGGVSLENIRGFALACERRPADYISVGRLTHSAPVADFSIRTRTLS